MFWMYSFKLRKVVRLNDPRHFDNILPLRESVCCSLVLDSVTSTAQWIRQSKPRDAFLFPEDNPHRIDLSADASEKNKDLVHTTWCENKSCKKSDLFHVV
jgi:hypothetical protein